jgi:hypothetical protein
MLAPAMEATTTIMSPQAARETAPAEDPGTESAVTTGPETPDTGATETIAQVTGTAATSPAPTAVAPATETTAAVQVVSGQLPEGAFFLGDANAPLTVIDYSDFL